MKNLNGLNIHGKIKEPLSGPFEEIQNRIEAFPLSIESTILAIFVESLVNFIEFDSNRFSNLPPASLKLCLKAMIYHMNEGLSKEERSAIYRAIKPYLLMVEQGTRH